MINGLKQLTGKLSGPGAILALLGALAAVVTAAAGP
jgi:hypothetical protein